MPLSIRMNILNLAIYGIIVLGFFIDLKAQNNSSAFQFLNRPYSPKASALGNSGTADGSDLNNVLLNPSLSSLVKQPQVSLNYFKGPLDLKAGSAFFTYPSRSFGSFGLGVIYFDYGQFTEFDQFARPTGQNFQAVDAALLFNYSYMIFNQISLGLSFKFLQSQIAQYSARAVASDFGLLYKPKKFLPGFTFGLGIFNLGKNYEPFQQKEEDLPFNWRFGMVKSFQRIPLQLFFDFQEPIPTNRPLLKRLRKFSLGAEYRLTPNFMIRLGFDNRLFDQDYGYVEDNLLGLSAGFGLKFKQLSLDYAIKDNGSLSITHLFGLRIQLKPDAPAPVYRAKLPFKPVGQLPSPKNVTIADFGKVLKLQWSPILGMQYNVYVRSPFQDKWTKINTTPLETPYLVIKKPTSKGKYFFIVTAVHNNFESYPSQQITVILSERNANQE